MLCVLGTGGWQDIYQAYDSPLENRMGMRGGQSLTKDSKMKVDDVNEQLNYPILDLPISGLLLFEIISNKFPHLR